ncbi:MAG: hypothetical protein WBX11_01165 [Thiobacillaceae bacterium]|jgi:hypothetical protein
MPFIPIIARTVLLESLRTRFWPIYGLVLLICLGAAIFMGQLAIADVGRIRIITLAALSRPLLAFLLILHIAAAITRETQEKGLDMVMAAGLPGPVLIIGRLTGYSMLSAMMAAGAGFVLLSLGARVQLISWTIGLACELSLLAAFTLAVSVVLRQVASTTMAAAFFYILGHSLGAILLLARHPLADYSGHAESAARAPIEAMAWLIPRFDLFGSADWLAGLRTGHLPPIFIQTAIYLLSLFAIATLDLKRKGEPA